MLARSRRSEKLIRRERHRSGDDTPARLGRDEVSPGSELAPRQAPAALDPARPDADPSLDTAVYNCHCGMVFEAPVCTSVDCPHCGVAQAW